MYEIEDQNPSVIRYIVNDSIYRIHQTVYVGFEHNILYRQYTDIIWEQASEYIEEYIKENETVYTNQNKTFIVKSDETSKYKSFFLIKKSELIEEGYKVWNCMIYIFNKTLDSLESLEDLESLENLESLELLESYTAVQV